MPPGYLGFISPSDFRVLQKGVTLVLPSFSSSWAAWAAIIANIPVVIGQPIVAPCLFARVLRISLRVISFPFVTCFIISLTSIGAGITMVPVPHLVLILSVIGSTLGNSLLSANFSRHDFLLYPIFNLQISDWVYFHLIPSLNLNLMLLPFDVYKVQDLSQGVLFAERSSLGCEYLEIPGRPLRSSIGCHKRDVSQNLDPLDAHGTTYRIPGIASNQDESIPLI